LNWSKKKVLVTGAGGFIGSHLTERLVELGADTRAFVHYNSLGKWGWLDNSPLKNKMEVFPGDIIDRDSISKAVKDVDIIFHLAALIGIPYSYHAPISYIRTNIEGSYNVFQEAHSQGVDLVVHTSTSEVYGTARYVPIDEDHPLQGQSPYSATKIGADKLAEAFFRSFELPVITLRPFNTYGPRQSSRAVIPTIVSQALAGGDINLGSLSPTRDFNFVGDTVEGFICAANSQKAIGKVINVGTSKEISIGDLAKRILSLMDISVKVKSVDERQRPPESEVDRLCAGTDLANDLLDWVPKISLDQGLRITIDWIKENYQDFRPEQYQI
jgi:dTDP-glucose 4,6-dehydratase